jgi:phosphoribosylformimino-5-aminoimidazole carboxamide ribotide isomerase
MLIIPAIDIHQGKCVRLSQGKLEQETIYSTDPVFLAKIWCAKGAERIHIVDLDGAFCGVVQNWELLENIRKNVDCIIQFGGGVRNMKTIQKLIKLGIDRVICSTLIVYNPKTVIKAVEKYDEKIMASVDINNGKIALAGWKEITNVTGDEIIKKLESMNIKEMVVTDITKDGMLQGPNIELIKQISEITQIKIIASGGITTINDIYKFKQLEKNGVIGVIIGKALYNETIKFEDAMKIGKL